MGLLEPEKPKTKAEKLCDVFTRGLLKKKKIPQKIDVDKWNKDFQKLLDKGYSPENITKVLDWYIPRIGKENIPRIYSASSFRERFQELLKSLSTSLDGLDISPEVKVIHKLLKDYEWSYGLDHKLMGMIQRSYVNILSFRNKMMDLHKKLNKPDKSGNASLRKRNVKIIEHLMNRIGHPEHFLVNWFLDIHEDIHKMSRRESYTPRIEFLVFTEQNEKFQAYGRNTVYGFTGSSKDWDDLVNAPASH